MTDIDDELRDNLKQSWRAAADREPPRFDAVWGAAEARYLRQRNIYRAAVAAAVIAVMAIVLKFGVPTDETAYIEVAELLESTYWSAPSDALLPEKEFDIYEDMPSFIESTEPVGGALL
jgi:hypothetical protein